MKTEIEQLLHDVAELSSQVNATEKRVKGARTIVQHFHAGQEEMQIADAQLATQLMKLMEAGDEVLLKGESQTGK